MRIIHSRVFAVFVIAFAIQASICLLAISKNPATPFDEAAHFDYVVKLSHGHIPAVNEKYGQEVLEWMACQRDRGEAWKWLEKCGSTKYSPKLAPFYGQSSATGYVPTYYVITAIPFEFCSRATSLEPIVCGRIANSIWLDLAAGVTAVVLFLMGAGKIVSVTYGIGMSSLPAVLLQGITVNSDAAVQALAPLLCLLVISILYKDVGDRYGYWILGAASFVALTIKQTILPVLIWVFISFAYSQIRKNGSRSYIRETTIAALTFSTSLIGSTALLFAQPIFRGIGGKDYMTDFLRQPASDFGQIIGGVFTSVLLPFGTFVWDPLSKEWMIPATLLVTILTWQLALQSNGSSQLKVNWDPILEVGFIASIIGPVVLAIGSWLTLGSAPVQPRYYMATLAMLGGLGIARTNSRIIRHIITCVLIVFTSATVMTLFFTFPRL